MVSHRGERMNALGSTGMEEYCGVWCIGSTVLVNGGGFLPLAEGR